MLTIGTTRLYVLFGVLLAIASPAMAEISQWHGLVVPPFAQTSASADCCDDSPCAEQELAAGEVVSSSCFGTCDATGRVIFGASFIRISGESEHDIFNGNWSAGSAAQVDVYPVISGKLPLQYNLFFEAAGGPPLAPPLPSLEVVVFRYSGGAQAFDGQIGLTGQRLLDLGFIAPGDVLYFDQLTENSTAKSVDVDLGGIPASDVAVLASGYGVLPSNCGDDPGDDGDPGDDSGDDGEPGDVPASTRGFALLLVLAVMTASASILIRRRRRVS